MATLQTEVAEEEVSSSLLDQTIFINQQTALKYDDHTPKAISRVLMLCFRHGYLTMFSCMFDIDSVGVEGPSA